MVGDSVQRKRKCFRQHIVINWVSLPKDVMIAINLNSLKVDQTNGWRLGLSMGTVTMAILPPISEAGDHKQERDTTLISCLSAFYRHLVDTVGTGHLTGRVFSLNQLGS